MRVDKKEGEKKQVVKKEKIGKNKEKVGGGGGMKRAKEILG